MLRLQRLLLSLLQLPIALQLEGPREVPEGAQLQLAATGLGRNKEVLIKELMGPPVMAKKKPRLRKKKKQTK